MTQRWIVFAAALPAFALTACGGGTTNESTESAVTAGEGNDVGVARADGPKVAQVDLATALDASGLKLAAPSSKEFLPDTQTVYLLATLENLPPEADIEVRWTESTEGAPISVTHASGSGTYTFSSQFDLGKFAAAEKNAAGMNIQALIFVNGRKAGGTSFTISDRRDGGLLRVKELAVSGAVEAGTNLPVKSSQSFRKGTKKVIASFYVGGLEPGATIRVRWLHDDNMVREDDIESEGEKRYATVMEGAKGKGIAFGDWRVEVEILGDVFASRSFYMGDESGGPAVDTVALGLSVGKNHMPRKALTTFKQKPGAIHCGIKFLYAPSDAKVEVQWISLTEGSENILQTTETTVKKEGSASVSMAWRPGKALAVGPYKASVLVNGAKAAEVTFEVR